jgi:hypothetical protein
MQVRALSRGTANYCDPNSTLTIVRLFFASPADYRQPS